MSQMHWAPRTHTHTFILNRTNSREWDTTDRNSRGKHEERNRLSFFMQWINNHNFLLFQYLVLCAVIHLSKCVWKLHCVRWTVCSIAHVSHVLHFIFPSLRLYHSCDAHTIAFHFKNFELAFVFLHTHTHSTAQKILMLIYPLSEHTFCVWRAGPDNQETIKHARACTRWYFTMQNAANKCESERETRVCSMLFKQKQWKHTHTRAHSVRSFRCC